MKNKHPHYPLFIYQVSGEYAMLEHASRAGSFDRKNVILEVLTSMRRAGGDVIISYFTPQLLKWMTEKWVELNTTSKNEIREFVCMIIIDYDIIFHYWKINVDINQCFYFLIRFFSATIRSATYCGDFLLFCGLVHEI